MSTNRILTDTATATVAGYVGTKAMERFNMATYQNVEPDADRQREDEVRPGPPPKVAVENFAERALGVELTEDQAMKAGMVAHQLSGLSATPLYLLLRRVRGWRPVTAGLATGAALSLVLDELITPAIGASAPNRDYPTSTHIRAFVSHLVYGLAVAGVIEAGWRLTGTTPE